MNNKKCKGCGVLLQTINENEEGFVKEANYEKSLYCERCFKLINYGKYTEVKNNIDIESIIKTINEDASSSVAFIIDILNINESLIKYINSINNKKYILLSKRDVMPKSLKEAKIIEYFRNNIYNSENIMCISSFKNYNIDEFLNKLKKDGETKTYIVGFTNSGKSTFINHILTSINKDKSITESAHPNTTSSFIEVKIDDKLTIIDTPGFIDENAIYNFLEANKLIKFYPKKEIRVKTFQMREGESIVLNDFLRIESLSNYNSFSFYMSDNLRYEKVKNKNFKLKKLDRLSFDIKKPTDILINGMGFIRITKIGKVDLYVINKKLVTTRKSMITHGQN